MNVPAELKYTKEHEWIKIEGNIGIIGITDYAQNELGDIVFVDIDSNITDFSANDNIGSIEAVKTVSEVYAPCSGKLLEVNPKVSENPEIINDDPYGEGWMLKIEISDPAELDSLLDEAAYKEVIGG